MIVTKDQWLCQECWLMYSTIYAAQACHNTEVLYKAQVTFEQEEDGPDLFTEMQDRINGLDTP